MKIEYPIKIVFVFGDCTSKKGLKLMQQEIKRRKVACKYPKKGLNWRASCNLHKGVVYLCFYRAPKRLNLRFEQTIAHECIHAAFYVFQYIKSKITNDEPFAYLYQSIYKAARRQYDKWRTLNKNQ